MFSSEYSFQMVVYRGWSGQLGKLAPLVMIISKPQQKLLYTPNLSLISPFCGTVCYTPKIMRIRASLYASTYRTNTDKNAFWMAYRRNRITTRPKASRRLP